ncbi:ABC-type branched-subunit amino acid transport system ATPase component [Actinomadura namibiensis]|uniref:ABC-type branched-subunit amino acid transport system ATPase component n=2 Tax=Actinomadura TaxID=1988 RepID=A0A7W3LNC5_ACTNM|nr:ABC-type branched-subunit amino acid transport system ATPase component [Actinomadura namibiensis]
MKVDEFVRYAAYYKRVREPQVRAVLKRFELSEAAGAEMGLLPPDVRLRAGLAATCVHEPDLVLLDDPFAGLEAAAAAELVPVVRTLAPSVVVAAEAAGPLAGWCDRLFTLARGRLTELPDAACADPAPMGPLHTEPAPAGRIRAARPLVIPVPDRRRVARRLRLALLTAGSGAGV